jgi:hypothetical protein
MMGFLASTWAAISGVSQATWAAAALAKSISAFNEFCSANLLRWQNWQAPTQADPAAEASSALTISAHTYTGGPGQVNLSMTVSGTTSLSGIAILRAAAEITAPDWTKVIAVLPVSTVGPHIYIDSPLEAGTYHYRVVAFNVDGKMGTVLADDTGAAT